MLTQNPSTSAKTKREPIYSASDIASLLGLTLGTVNYRIKALGLVPESKTNTLSEAKLKGKKLYKGEVMVKIRDYKNHPPTSHQPPLLNN